MVLDNVKVKMGSGNDANHATFSGSLTAARTITMPDANVALADIATNKSSIDGHVDSGTSKHDASEIDVEASDGNYHNAEGLEAVIGKLDAQIKTNADAIGAGSDDQTAAEVSYTPAVAADWDGDADPGSTKDALDQLAERVDDNEIAVAAIDDHSHSNKAVLDATTASFLTADESKLDAIEASADVTDATNVAAAGAVMEGDTTTASMSFVVDEDNMSSDSATKLATQQSIKKYVDDEVAGAVASEMSYKGAYDADANSPDLDSSPSGIAIGDMYTVTVAGTFFTTAVEIGDVLIAEIDDADAEAEWTIVNKNLDAASIKTLYESNAQTNAFTDTDESKLDAIEASADVTDATNVAAAGAVMEGDTTIASMSFVLDEDAMGSDSATKLATQQSIKAYVDSQVGGATPDASAITFTPTTAADWDSDSDPGNVDDALDQLAERVDDNEIAIGAIDDHSHSNKSTLDNITAAYTTAEETKLSNIETSADVTDATNVAAAGAVMEGDGIISKTMVAGESFAADVVWAIRMSMNGETDTRVYKADDDAGSSDKFHVVGLAYSVGAIAAGESIEVVMLGEILSSVVFTASQDEGKAVYLGSSGVVTLSPSSTADDAVVKIGVVSKVGAAATAKILVSGIQVIGVN